ncbi:deoxyguanosinetriphosphate triphosphohydrolase [Nisaea acidiphila]|uniref:Deoxyguanosinetriphosphate triphosphohydrolase-like protein n=1 Tax=Nisaea acidiphila TaxID=1862145 RepID=A0A9J7ARV4_9PROT|nr:deoxyguanosinetriphosphate triphosphohydrolase [Nisaea acidiphila]UUX50088.1 deoxyguanosinetriphosphate triphosphohydrolase [Nisaea acidiphila]
MPESQNWTLKQQFAPYAEDYGNSRGRQHPEPEARERTPFQRDRDRILHSGAFRRLEYKTQVFVYHEGDYYRTRLTHSLEVAQIARSISRSLGLNEDLAEALALAHDLGHTPFGHAGEDGLDAVMAPYGGFDHNVQTVRVLTLLEQRYAAFDGLNPTWETLEGIIKHNGPLVGPGLEGEVPPIIAELDDKLHLQLGGYASAEAQVAAISDDIAYHTHDIDDALHANLFAIETLREAPIAGDIVAEVQASYGDLSNTRLVQEIVRRLIGMMVEDLLSESRKRLAEYNPRSADDIRQAPVPIIAFSPDMEARNKALKKFLFQNMYRHYKVNRMASKARRVVKEMFELLMNEPNCLPAQWQRTGNDQPGDIDKPKQARLIADYIAGMTDRYAMIEHARLFDLNAKT